MRTLIVIAVLLAVAYAAPRRLAPVEPATGQVVNDEYIVIFNEQATDELVEKHHQKLASVFAQFNDTRLRVMHQYHLGSFRGYSARLNDRSLMMVREELIVKYIDHNQVVTAYQRTECEEQTEAPSWGLYRISNRDKPTDKTYKYPNAAGEGVVAYIIDTGIYIEHNDFEGRAVYGYDAIKEGSSQVDLNGHGTHVAGTVIGAKYGIAKKATAIAVKVLNQYGSGTYDQVIEGVVWAGNDHASKRNQKSVANMSLGGGFSQSMNDAVAAAVDKGVAFAVAAGNSNTNACGYSPAAEEKVTTVVASTIEDTFASYTNYGGCAEIIAPGSGITSAWIRSPDAVNTISGTSMASPHVAGVMAVVLSTSTEDLTPQQLEDRLIAMSTPDKIDEGDKDRPEQVNKLLYLSCES